VRCATRGRYVDNFLESNASKLWPGHGSAYRCLLPSSGSSRHEFSGFHGTMRHSDTPPAVSPRFVSFAWRYHTLVETVGSPKFLGNPLVPMPSSLTPAGPMHQATSMHRHGPCPHDNKGSLRVVISGLNGTASALPVYASPGGSLHRTQDSVLVAGQALPGGIRTRRIPAKGFRNGLHHFPLSQASWRSMRPLSAQKVAAAIVGWFEDAKARRQPSRRAFARSAAWGTLSPIRRNEN